MLSRNNEIRIYKNIILPSFLKLYFSDLYWFKCIHYLHFDSLNQAWDHKQVDLHLSAISTIQFLSTPKTELTMSTHLFFLIYLYNKHSNFFSYKATIYISSNPRGSQTWQWFRQPFNLLYNKFYHLLITKFNLKVKVFAKVD